ncbi:helix-turn-helix transcriptional regulator [Megasphaera sp.]|uniref:helix-turn-helix transcriptional regulator n=1 Tax=Megasphaera sp. TaxID=2023260 RepID=UPI0025B7BF2F|nr:helix-turn-helix transcriptional regulator [Megasphaera sp.]MCF0154000.1 helix-turn-helix transcriptional regulator [Megasphaera sp.]MCF0256490.1 helix-turn-helix transcriptional regulator [Bacteroides heparinolyticus]
MDAEMIENIRANVRYYRIVKGISGRQLSAAIGLSPTWICCFESGIIRESTPKNLQMLAKALGKKLSDLIKPPKAVIQTISPKEAEQGLQNLERIRKQKGLSVKQFEMDLGLCEGHLYKALEGRRKFTIETWWKIAEALDMDLKTLIGRKA